MLKFLAILPIGIGLLAIAPAALAQGGYTTTFQDLPPNDYQQGTLSGQNGWDTNDPSNGQFGPAADGTPSSPETVGQSDYVGFVGGFSLAGPDVSAGLGGLVRGPGGQVPGSNPVYLFHTFSVTGATTTTFNVDFQVSTSNGAFPAKDSFAWTFRNGTTNDFSILFSPSVSNPGTIDNVSYTSNVAGTAATGSISLNNRYHLTVTVNNTNSTFTAIATPEDGTTGLLAGVPVIVANNISFTGPGDQINQVAATWLLKDNTQTPVTGAYAGAGSNALVFDNYSVVPEPSTYVLAGVGLMAVAAFMKRRGARLA